MDQPIERVFSTSDVEPGLQLAYWREAVAEQCGATTFEWATDEPGSAAVTVRPSTELTAMECASSPVRFQNSGRLPAAASDCYTLMLHLEGTGLYRQGGCENTAVAGDLVVTDVTAPFEIQMSGHRVRSWALPRATLEPLLADCAPNAHIPGRSVLGMLLRSFLGTHWRVLGRYHPQSAAELEGHLYQLVALALGANGAEFAGPSRRGVDHASWIRHTAVDPQTEQERRKWLLGRRFGLTPTEAAFALEIAKGDGKAATAKRRGISYSTAHTHLTRIFEKTGTHRQAELVRLFFETWIDNP